MNTVEKTILAMPLLALSLLANAQEVYKRVQEDGTVEYSDMPFPDSQIIEVDPNVVEVTPEKRPQSSPQRAEVRQEQRAPEKLEADRNVYVREEDKDRLKHRAVEEKNEHEQKHDVARPNPRQGVHRDRARAGGRR
jgi:hypothetical protein